MGLYNLKSCPVSVFWHYNQIKEAELKDAVLPLYLIGNEKCRCSNSSEKEVQLFSNQAISLRNLVLKFANVGQNHC